MQQLYVVGFEVSEESGASEVPSAEGREGRPGVFERLLTHMEQHVEPGTTGLTGAALMAQKGSVDIAALWQGRPDQRVSWSPVTVAADVRALRMEIEQDLPGGGGRFLCRLTASQHGEATGFRVVMGRRNDGLLAPARVEDLKPPRALKAVMRDGSLRCTDGGDRITAVVLPALTAQIPAVRAQLRDPGRRLPVLVVSSVRTVGPPADFARKAASRLAGLAHVVVVSGWLAFHAFNSDVGPHLLPLDGARLYWPGMEARPPWWEAGDLHGDHDVLLGRLTRLLSPLSVVARGRDRLWDSVRAAETDALLDDLADTESEQVGGLLKALEDERTQSVELLVRNEELENQAARLQIEIANLTAQLGALSTPAAEPEEVRERPPGEPRDFGSDWARWTEVSGGALVFTANAKDEWSRCSYPYPDRMWEALETLAELAREWRTRRGSLGRSLVSWIGDRTPLMYAPLDEGLRRARLHEFTFEGRRKPYDRQPHIKLDDHTTPDRVGRIYFAIDNESYRWIVDHVGLKLYGR
ncbi:MULTISPECIES: hypothetical protein [Streptomyces]|uniref:Uncharacterized protein n=2 Tax=Streptomyces TaxID=1883 RepID=A0A3M8F2M1_9ACTN|nr:MULTISPECIES: hypothetical protein [Streptomyces]KNE82675.1 hypothetical protein ADZ36_09615 [Streptomyces fradiae]OFA52340.1 hypothetical protein BEN35_11775 [Streptomyces fradiae]PQM21008.1 hypothetical protein Sfr7A_23470 [Streptomyces xinghaiensis]RKM92862.1 hypothetical protein SFRA_023420 [Streptomyces xinghaiensis]RNC72450.1 hypothetical protein DC095_018910 [Streptomyces xinghaiensis]